MQNIRTSSLFHYTSLENLKQILVNGLIPNYCKEVLSTDRTTFFLGIPMICFCDIPLTRVSDFTNHYGQYAIGLNKDYAIEHNLNPILYVADTNIIASLSFFKSYEMATLARLKERGGKKNQIQVNLLDQKSLDGIVDLVNYNNAHSANTALLGYVKEYLGTHNGVEHCNYNENEWRYLIKEDKEAGIPWFWDKEAYKQWRGNGAKPKASNALIERKLEFSTNSISHIIVSKESEISDIVSFIRNLQHIGGSKDGISDKEKDILCTRIISLERIDKDF